MSTEEEKFVEALSIYTKKFNKNGIVTNEEFVAILRSFGLDFNEAEAKMLQKYFEEAHKRREKFEDEKRRLKELEDEKRKLKAEAEEWKEKADAELEAMKKEVEAAKEEFVAVHQWYHLLMAELGLAEANPC
ncbi:Oidioi.mRNA.OKI2018_I69.chr1.g1284.t1.cds [Oikopleura dioica]|uniref:Oidioi.mRNA.OKI2018_I69.chr1.g1284.t1.cds n=1 Tax=Oikopleura dioica TaxID=34765 RepID=A0ABN7SMG0_OIKDI|nr:Oidioi.mRNA.OKI2018_I69.chr1.g1284.t1.cds [Oikopleura dioica]